MLDMLAIKLNSASVYGEFNNRDEFRENEPLPTTYADGLDQEDDVRGLWLDCTEILENRQFV